MVAACSGAQAADLVQRSPACSHIATVQYLDCEVSVLYSCPGPKLLATPLIREEAFNADGFSHFEVDTANGGLVVTGDAAGSYVIRADAPTLKETALAEVQATGRGSFSASATLTMFGVTKPASQKIKIVATGETAEFSGLPAVVFMADVAIDLPQPMGPTVSTAKAYLVPSLGVYLAGEASAGTFFKPDDTPHRPMSVALPGRPGFDVTRPGFCGGSLSLLFPPIRPTDSLNGVPA
jgi:hypothetical protein